MNGSAYECEVIRHNINVLVIANGIIVKDT